ncbi:S-type pyocin domain-containing protein [Streptomyces chrestomyceticus]|uniref:S-type pyocin domain-containing protein n=1 Tax=Streptomyces chrestomyceticus TaxID=68185 RepID=UPI000F616319|nr:S-type pyocin domain-containing protein [Streptomyces chrestomyceticus]
MRAEEDRSTDNVSVFRRPQGVAEAGAVHRAVPEAHCEGAAPPATVLNAERGIINTGTVHGGQHMTAIEISGHSDGGADSGS